MWDCCLFISSIVGNVLVTVYVMIVSFLSAMMFWNKIARWSLFAVVWTLPLRAMALEPVRYRCGSLGEVSVDRSRAHPTKAVVALKWAVREMEDRYRLMAQMGVRNITGYNSRLKDAKKRGEEGPMGGIEVGYLSRSRSRRRSLYLAESIHPGHAIIVGCV